MDNGSVFTKDIAQTLSNSNVKYEQKSFSEINPDEIEQFDSFILSGRRQNDSEMNAKNSKIILHAVNEKKETSWNLLWSRNSCIIAWWNNS